MGLDWSIREGYAWVEDKEHCEEYGRMLQADPTKARCLVCAIGVPIHWFMVNRWKVKDLL